MRITSLFCDADGGQNRFLDAAWRWGAALLGQRRDGVSHRARRAIEFALDTGSLCRIAGNNRGLRIDCRQGRLWLTQAGVAADVILQPGQGFVAGDGGAIVVQSMATFNAPAEVALGTLTVVPSEAGMKIRHRRPEAGATMIRAGSEWLEQLIFIALWLCSLFGVANCLKVCLSLF